MFRSPLATAHRQKDENSELSDSFQECGRVLVLPPTGREAERVAVKTWRSCRPCCRRTPRRSLVMLDTALDPSVREDWRPTLTRRQ